MRNTIVMILGTLLATGSAGASMIYYNNTTGTDTLTDIDFTAGPYDGIGDSITVAGDNVVATDALTQFYNDGGDGTFSATLEFFNAGSPVGSQIPDATFTETGISAPAAQEVNVDFQLGALALPDNVVFLLSVTNDLNTDMGIELYNDDPSDVGSNTQDTAIILQDSAFSQPTTSVNGGNPAFELSSGLPEPSTWLLTAGGLIAATWFSRRRRATNL